MDLKDLADLYNFRINRVKQLQKAVIPRSNIFDMSNDDSYFNYETIPYNVLEAEVAEEDLRYILEAVHEYTDLLKDSDCREFISQAKFVHRLKKGMV